MSTIRFYYKTVLKHERFVAGLTDFGPETVKAMRFPGFGKTSASSRD